MNEHRRSLTPQERREFEEIQARLSEEMSNVELERPDRQRWRRRAHLMAAIVGLGLLVAGLLVAIVAIAFVGFVLLLLGVWWISNRLHVDDWAERARSLLSPQTRTGRDGSSGHP